MSRLVDGHRSSPEYLSVEAQRQRVRRAGLQTAGQERVADLEISGEATVDAVQLDRQRRRRARPATLRHGAVDRRGLALISNAERRASASTTDLGGLRVRGTA